MAFKKATFDFLTELADNNDRDWFGEHKSRYIDDVLDPAVSLVQSLEKPLRKAAPFLVADARRSGGSILRIYRDTRFSKNKTPYKTHVGIQLRHDAGKDIHSPSIYIHIQPGGESLVAAGCFRPEASALAAIRAAIDARQSQWKRARDNKQMRAESTFWGESLKTSPRDYPKDHLLIEDLRRKDFIVVFALTDKQAISADLGEMIIQRIKWSKPYMKFLCEAVGVPY